VTKPRFKLYTVDEIQQLPSPRWRIEGLLVVGGFSMLYAPQEQMKTFFALDGGLCVATGTRFHGRAVKAGPVIYVLGEGRGGLKNRINAWLKHHGIRTVDDIFFILEAVQFKVPLDVDALKKQIDALNVKPAMVIVDTFARSAVGIDENDAKDVGLWIDAVRHLQEALRNDDIFADMLVLHHAQKGNAAGGDVRERGSSAFIGATDTVIRLKREKDKITVRCEKQKDADHFKDFVLQKKIIDLPNNEHREKVSSCVLVDSDAAPASPTLSADHLQMLRALDAFQTKTAPRSLWMAKLRSTMSERTFDRNRKDLLEGKFIESVKGAPTGTYHITLIGELAIANESPTDGRGEAA
jgi:hypothetical protein